MNRAYLWSCFDALMLAVILFSAALSGCARVYHEDYEGGRERVIRSRPAPAGLGLGGVSGAVNAAPRGR